MQLRLVMVNVPITPACKSPDKEVFLYISLIFYTCTDRQVHAAAHTKNSAQYI